MPSHLIVPLVYELIIFWGVGLNNSGQTFVGIWLAMVILSQVGASYGMIISASFDNLVNAQTFTGIVAIPLALFGGLFVDNNTILPWLRWVQWLSPVRYTFEMLLISEFNPRGLAFVYQDFLSFGTKFNFLYLFLSMVLIAIVARFIALIVLKLNIKNFQ